MSLLIIVCPTQSLWIRSIFSTPSPVDGVLQFSVRPEFISQELLCRNKDWSYLRAVPVNILRILTVSYVVSSCVKFVPFSGQRSQSYDNVDIYDAASQLWTSNQRLSFARTLLCGTSLTKQGIAIFAGGGGLFSMLFS